MPGELLGWTPIDTAYPEWAIQAVHGQCYERATITQRLLR
jgi:hypothetical protein